MLSTTRPLKRFGMMAGPMQMGELSGIDEFIRQVEKKGYHCFDVEQTGNQIFGWAIYVRNLPPGMKRMVKNIKELPPHSGDTVTWQIFGKKYERPRTR